MFCVSLFSISAIKKKKITYAFSDSQFAAPFQHKKTNKPPKKVIPYYHVIYSMLIYIYQDMGI